MHKSVRKIKAQIFDLDDPIDNACSCFEVINCEYPGYGKPRQGPQLPSMVDYAAGPGYGDPDKY
jgi:hypothetical protein